MIFSSLKGKQMKQDKKKLQRGKYIFVDGERKKHCKIIKRFFAHLFSWNLKFCYDIKDHLVLSGLDNFFISFNLNFHLSIFPLFLLLNS